MEERASFSLDFIETLPVGAFAYDSNLTIIGWNTELEKLTGVSQTDILGEQVFVLKEAASRLPEEFQRKKRCDIILTAAGCRYVFDVRPIKSLSDNDFWLGFFRKKLDTALENASNAVITTDRKGIIANINSVAENLTGWTDREAAGKALTAVLQIRTAEGEVLSRNLLDDVLEKGKTVSLSSHVQVVSRSAGISRAAFSAAPLKSADGKAIGAVVVLRDLTDGREHEQRVKELEERFRVAFKTSPDAIAITRLDNGLYLEVNEGFELMSGYSAKELVGRSSLDINIWKNTEDRRRLVEALQQKGFIENLDAQFVLKNGKVIDGLMSARIIMLGGEPHLLSITRDISERIKMERELAANEQRIRYILKHDPNAVAVLDRQMKYLMVSDRFLADYRLKEKKIIGKSHYEVFPEMPEKWKAIHRRCLKGAVEKNDMDYFVREDGSIDYVRWEVRPWYDREGALGGIVMYTEVITERVEAEKKLKERNEFIETILANLPIGVIVLKISSRKIDFINDKCKEIFELSGETPEYQRLYDILIPDPEYREKLRKDAEQIRVDNPGDSVFWEHVDIATPKKTSKVVSVFFLPLAKQDLQLTVIQDITERKRAEEERDRLFNFSLDMLFVAGFDGFLKQINPAWQKILGWSKEELMERPWIEWVHRDDQKDTRAAHVKLQTGENMILFENRFLCKDGGYKWLSWNAIPLTDQNLIFGAVRDISAAKSTEEELKQRNNELNNFVYKVSHDLRAPLSSISGLINLLKIDEPALGKHQYLNLIENRTQKLDAFIRDILSHSKNLNTAINVSRIDFEQVIDDCFAELAYLENSARIRKAVQVDGPAFFNDQVRIYEIFRNLISNAIKYINPFVEDNQVIVSVKTTAEEAFITISDNGLGIPAAHQPKIFDMFFKGSQKSDSSGMGLYIVQQAVKKLLGVVRVESEPNKGTTFILELPNRRP